MGSSDSKPKAKPSTGSAKIPQTTTGQPLIIQPPQERSSPHYTIPSITESKTGFNSELSKIEKTFVVIPSTMTRTPLLPDHGTIPKNKTPSQTANNSFSEQKGTTPAFDPLRKEMFLSDASPVNPSSLRPFVRSLSTSLESLDDKGTTLNSTLELSKSVESLSSISSKSEYSLISSDRSDSEDDLSSITSKLLELNVGQYKPEKNTAALEIEKNKKGGKRKDNESRLTGNVRDFFPKWYKKQLKSIWYGIDSLKKSHQWNQLLELKDPNLITLKIVSIIDDFLFMIDIGSWESIFVVSKVLLKVIECRYDYHKAEIISKFIEPLFLKDLIFTIKILPLPLQKNLVIDSISGLAAFYIDVASFYLHMTDQFCKNNLIDFTSSCYTRIDNMKNMDTFTDIRPCLENIVNLQNVLKGGVRHLMTHEDCFPVNIFKSKELVKNMPVGAFNDLGQYLYTHFSLLREEFESSVRDGILYRLKLPLNRSKGMSFYDVKLQAIAINEGFSFKVIFNKEQKFYNQDWETSTIFYTGSALFFTTTQFKSYFIGLVEDRKPLEIGQRYITVTFPFAPPIKAIQNLLMAESHNFFAPTRWVLENLRLKFRDDIIFNKYLIYGEKTVSYPSYLENNTSYKIGSRMVRVKDPYNDFPSAGELNMNESQRNCLKYVLTNELALVQGPPGTGKTFMCRKIIEVLLENKTVWSNSFNTPIVVVCFKNLSLDELLLGLVEKEIKVLRFGCGTKSEQLANEYNLYGVENSKDNFFYDNTNLRAKLSVLSKVGSQELAKMDIFENKKAGILSLKMLEDILSESDLKYLKENYASWILGIDLEPIKAILHKAEGFMILESDIKKIKNQTAAEQIRAFFTYYKHYSIHDNCDCENLIYENLESMDFVSRLILHSHWTHQAEEFNKSTVAKLFQNNLDLKGRMDELTHGKNFLKIAQSDIDVIGITTTAAARVHKLLNDLKPRIVIIEEAAEVLESHCIATLTKYCQHLILFGDHQQLRPVSQSFRLCSQYNLDISLFERLVNNKLDHSQLSIQYRMRPEIRSLINPSIYRKLTDDRSVQLYENVKGVSKNLFFFHHNNRESKTDGRSFSNPFECEFALTLVRYFIKQGYKNENVTVLAAYGAQERVMKKALESDFQDLDPSTVATIDSFQGKENDIVIISLVRNNPQNNVGFLTMRNRVCVALSRAKKGMFILGNMDNLKCSKLWQSMEQVLLGKNSIDATLILKCQVHRRETAIQTAEDIKNLKFGGCDIYCRESLPCGHLCTFECHPLDREHVGAHCCQFKCSKPLNCGHLCKYLCHDSEREHSCDGICDKKLKCGHNCKYFCHVEDIVHKSNYKCVTCYKRR